MNSNTAPLLIDRLFARNKVTDLLLVVGSVVFISLAAQLQIPMFPVPMTMQTFAVLLSAAAIGTTRAALSTTLYLGLGAAGLPIFAGTKTLAGALPTAGYLVGFVFASMVVGYLAAKGFTASAPKVILAFAAGSAVIYFFGVVGLMASLNLNLFAALSAGVVPFLIGDAVKAIAAAALLPTAWKLTNKN